jgi:thiol-disulfide isomerase/thioredoxin
VFRLFAIGCVLAALARDGSAGQATCSNPGVPVGAAASSELLPGRLTLNLTFGLLPVSSTETLDDVSGPVRYDSHLLLLETRLGAEYAITPRWALGGALPYRMVDVGVHYTDPSTGMERDPSFAGIHARDETIRGLGDPTLFVHYAAHGRRVTIHTRAGVTLPLGGTLDEDPFALGHIGQEHEHIQLGTGTFMPFGALEMQRRFDAWTASVWSVLYLSAYENGHGYKPGHRISGGLTGTRALTKTLALSLAAEVHAEMAEKWTGVVPEDEGNGGRYDVYAGVTAAWRATDRVSITSDVRVPLYSHVTGNQTDYGIVASLGLVTSFDIKPRASYRGADVDSLSPAGAAVPLVPVAGKITVFDLWADWCAPCRELDERLAALARAHPDRIAVRKLEVVDSDSAAWKAYLAQDAALPHVKVYGADGKLVFEQSGPPPDLIERIEHALR